MVTSRMVSGGRPEVGKRTLHFWEMGVGPNPLQSSATTTQQFWESRGHSARMVGKGESRSKASNGFKSHPKQSGQHLDNRRLGENSGGQGDAVCQDA